MLPATKFLATAVIAAILSTSCVFGGGDDEPEATATPAPTESEDDTPGNGDDATPTINGDGDTNDATPTTSEGSGDTPGTYTVQPGDRLSDIADQFGVTVDALVEENNIEDRKPHLPGAGAGHPVRRRRRRVRIGACPSQQCEEGRGSIRAAIYEIEVLYERSGTGCPCSRPDEGHHRS
ncbi:MAG: LysM domain-containing protein [Dehalococcoidia bacterium]|nr:LysM domain-containing protein [Dehalococcoidia bacterium]